MPQRKVITMAGSAVTADLGSNQFIEVAGVDLDLVAIMICIQRRGASQGRLQSGQQQQKQGWEQGAQESFHVSSRPPMMLCVKLNRVQCQDIFHIFQMLPQPLTLCAGHHTLRRGNKARKLALRAASPVQLTWQAGPLSPGNQLYNPTSFNFFNNSFCSALRFLGTATSMMA